MKKYIKYIVSILVLLTILIGFTLCKKANKEFIGGLISSNWENRNGEIGYMVSVDLDSGFSKDEIKYYANIATKKGRNQLDISKSINLGNHTHEMTVYREEKSTKTTDLVLNFNLWLYKDVGYIQSKNKKNGKIYKLETEEHKFILKALLKYYDEERIFKNISREL